MTLEELEQKYHMSLDEFVDKYKEYQEKAHYWKKECNHICRIKNEEIDNLKCTIERQKRLINTLISCNSCRHYRLYNQITGYQCELREGKCKSYSEWSSK